MRGTQMTVTDDDLVQACERVSHARDPEDFEDAVEELTGALLAYHGDPRYDEEVQEHLVRGPNDEVVFQSDKYPWCPAEFVPLRLTDKDARIVLEVYAQMHERRDAFFAADLQEAIELERARRRCEACGRPASRSDDHGTPLCEGCWDELVEDVGAGDPVEASDG